ncbi:MAG TPA: ABC transporter ATP-binding protein [Candidatus Acidoferrales bacterium]|nr:ABC transporter ATP-binding protein [Candidatus Acidoferrales bacterium]
MPEENLLEVQGLTVKYRSAVKEIAALNNVYLSIRPAQIVAVVGESGCGKSTLGLSIIRLLQKPPAEIQSGQILLYGKNLLSLTNKEMTKVRGTSISMIFQEPMSSLDPVYTVGTQIEEAIDVREKRGGNKNYGPFPRNNPEIRKGTEGGLKRILEVQLPHSRKEMKYSGEAVDVLKRVQIADPERVLNKYPHELSGGMVQRVMVAQALVERPSILIADEPTSAIDVTTQAQVLKLMRELRNDVSSSILLITHDLAVAAQVAERIAVMYAGEIVEYADVTELFEHPSHPYTEGLLRSLPRQYRDEGRLESIAGDVPDLKSPPPGCRFHPRCKYAFERCRVEHPELVESNSNSKVACFLRYQN